MNTATASPFARRADLAADLNLKPSRRAWLVGTLGALALPALAAPRPAALPIPLAQDAPPEIDPRGYLVSEKYDGVRAVWDGRQLRFRSGLKVTAPGWFLARLPHEALDGELWIARGQFEALSGAVRRQQPDDAEWRQIRYQVFDLPGARGGFTERHQTLLPLLRQHGWSALQPVAQQRFSDAAALQRHLDEVVRGGGEGLILRREDAAYAAGRSEAMLKLKPLSDAEATVIAIEPGRGKHAGRMGALHVRTDEGVRFKIGTGFSDAQREQPPRPGERVTFAYRGLTDEGVPRFASFMRVRPAGL